MAFCLSALTVASDAGHVGLRARTRLPFLFLTAGETDPGLLSLGGCYEFLQPLERPTHRAEKDCENVIATS